MSFSPVTATSRFSLNCGLEIPSGRCENYRQYQCLNYAWGILPRRARVNASLQKRGVRLPLFVGMNGVSVVILFGMMSIMASTPKRQPRRRSNAKRDAAIFADSYVGGGNLDNHQLAEKYDLTPSAVSTVLSRQKKRERKDQGTPEVPAVHQELSPVVDSDNSDQTTLGYEPRPLTQGQRQMLVVEYREQGASHEQAITMAGVSDKGGKNAVRVDRTAEPAVTQLVKDGITSVNDAMTVMLFPADVQRQAATEVAVGRAKKLAVSDAARKYVVAITPSITNLNQRQSRKPSTE